MLGGIASAGGSRDKERDRARAREREEWSSGEGGEKERGRDVYIYIINGDHARREKQQDNGRIGGLYAGGRARKSHSYTFLDLIFFIAEASARARACEAASLSLFHAARLTARLYISRRDIVLRATRARASAHVYGIRITRRVQIRVFAPYEGFFVLLLTVLWLSLRP